MMDLPLRDSRDVVPPGVTIATSRGGWGDKPSAAARTSALLDQRDLEQRERFLRLEQFMGNVSGPRRKLFENGKS